ncbi:hypothetical protein BHM03_00005199 [Ensete ventricosum]|nr:hypothetical protein BHM03_00005199 [Ensete ventricosum]
MSPCNAGHGFFDLAVSLGEASGGLFGIAWDALPSQIGLLWMWVRGRVVVPLVRIAVVLCLVMSIILLIEKVSMGLVSLYVKVFRRKPEKIYKWERIQADEELGSSAYPMVLVQVPMFNEREVTNGYKAGAMKEAMEIDYVRQCDYVAIFDADFQPASDFLVRTVPFLMHNPEIALVQARWKFGKHVPTSSNLNADECLMTKIQEMSLNYHFKVEQQAGSSTIEFFGFNGTTDHVRHGKFLRLEQRSELYRVESSASLKKERLEIFFALVPQKVSMVKRFFMLYNFFFARRVIAHNVTFFFYCMIIPLSCFFPEIQIPNWGVIYIPTAITLLSAVATPRFGFSSPRRPFLDLGTAVDVCSPSVSDPFT